MAFKRATKNAARLRLAITGPSGSGKTYTALRLARALVGPEGKIALGDTEHGSAAKYADLFAFDEPEGFGPPWHPDKFTKLLDEAARAGYDALIIDSLTHAWAGKGGLLEEVDKLGAKAKGGNRFAVWKDATPIQHRMIEAILAAPLHVICTMRSKTEWILEEYERDGRKSTKPVKIGMAPVQRDGVEYEFDLVLDMDQEHKGIVSKSRCPALDGDVIAKPGEETAAILREWLTGAPAPPPCVIPDPAPSSRLHPAPVDHEEGPPDEPPPADEPEPPTEAQLNRLEGWVLDRRLTEKTRNYIAEQMSRGLTLAAAGALIGRIKERFATELSTGKAEPGADG